MKKQNQYRCGGDGVDREGLPVEHTPYLEDRDHQHGAYDGGREPREPCVRPHRSDDEEAEGASSKTVFVHRSEPSAKGQQTDEQGIDYAGMQTADRQHMSGSRCLKMMTQILAQFFFVTQGQCADSSQLIATQSCVRKPLIESRLCSVRRRLVPRLMQRVKPVANKNKGDQRNQQHNQGKGSEVLREYLEGMSYLTHTYNIL